jgi:Rps23 Pro-64 3,4-dihydroxylase Tpa1-like proline 4-hydroxylase
MKEKIVQLICSNLEANLERLKCDFSKSISEVGVRSVVLDDLLPHPIAEQIYKAFPGHELMRLMDSFRERKYTSKSFEKFNPLMADITFAIQDPRVVTIVEKITGIKNQIPDSHLYAGGLSAMGRGHFLGPHIDNSHDGQRKHYRTLNLLYYVTPNWSLECGGNLELWDHRVDRCTTIVSSFNRLVIMETNPWSWHSVSEVAVDHLRYCVSNYYFSPISPTGQDYFNVTSFSARPEQKLLRAVAWADNKLRQAVRFIAPDGVGKKDIYQGQTK